MATKATGEMSRRADAVRNVESIIGAAITCLARDPRATMADIAKEAGLGRVTLYGHFASRPALVDAVVARVLERGERVLAEIDVDGDPRATLARLIRSSWRLVDQSRAVVVAAQDELSAERIRQLHEGPAARVQLLIEHGRERGDFRTDMPVSWLVAMLHQILHGAGAEVSAGRLDPAQAPELVTKTVFALLDPR
ncbi:TetR/AcrR family transcriptional regulator [Occultella aeris]|uniref:HTH-type transcriptional repressor KstR2 n=2 Tax=Occultella aeris TaxID=2761496 RepID=A0A7M4DKR2_9MICO|nr:HTH-type transcriptional repressor KstR2 [Occultella aeris]